MNNKKNPEYIVKDAAKVIYENISTELKSKLTADKIADVLDVGFEFYNLKGLLIDGEPNEEISKEQPFIDMDELGNYLVDNCVKKEIYLTQEEASKILQAEEIYMRQIGIIK